MANPETRAGPIVIKLVAGLQEDIQEIADLLSKARDLAKALEEVSKGVNGLSGFLKAKGNELENIVTGLREESANVERKMLGTRVEASTKVDHAHVERVTKARAQDPEVES